MSEKDTPTNKLNKKLDDLESCGMAKTQRWVSMWQDSMKYFFSCQLEGHKAKKGWDWVIINYIWPSAIAEICKLSKNNPTLIANPWDDKDSDAAEAWQSNLQWQWEKGINGTGMRIEQLAAILDGKLYGYRVSKVFNEEKSYWDTKQKKWMSDVKYRLWNPAHFWATGDEKISDGDCGTVRYVDLSFAQQRWPDFANELESESKKFKDLDSGGVDSIRGQTSVSGTYPLVGTGGVDSGVASVGQTKLLEAILGSKNIDITDERRFVKISEFYFHDYETKHQKIEQPVPQEHLLQSGQMITDGISFFTPDGIPMGQDNWPKVTIQEYDEPIYPLGRYIIRAGKETILNPDHQTQIWTYSKWPFITSPHYLLPHMWQGADGVQMYKSAQDMINVTVSHLVNNMKMFGDPKIAVESGAIATPPGRSAAHYKIGSGAGSIIRLVRGGLSRFKILDPVSPSAAELQLYGLFSQEFRNLVGLQNIATGAESKGSLTATEAQYLAISSNDRIALQNVFEEEWVKNVGSAIAEICQQTYDIGRWIRIIGDDGVVGAQEITQRMKEVRFDVDLVTGSQLPFDEEKKIMKYEKAMMALQSPVANPMLPEFLRALGISGWKKILQKYTAWQKFMQFAQLYQMCVEGKMQPQQAAQVIIQEMLNTFNKGVQSGQIPAPKEKPKGSIRKTTVKTTGGENNKKTETTEIKKEV